MKKHTLSIIFVSSLLMIFQNCAQAPGAGGSNGLQSAEVVVASTSDVSKVTYDPALEFRVVNTAEPSLSVDLQAGTMSLTKPSSSKSCAIDSARLASLDNLLREGKVCKPAPSSEATCMAIGLADIKLEGSSEIYLRPEICNNGRFLCEGQDQNFRAILSDLVANPPASCL